MKRRPPKLTATSALELQDELARYWRTKLGSGYFEGWQGARQRDGMGRMLFPGVSRAEMEARAMLGARTYLISEDMLALADHATKTMPPQGIMETDLPCPNGVMWFERGLAGPDVRGKTVVTNGMLWRRMPMNSRNGEMKMGLMWTFYSDMHDERDEYANMDEESMLPPGIPRAMPIHEDAEIFGYGERSVAEIAANLEAVDGLTPEIISDQLRTTHRLAIALWSLIRDWADVKETLIDRHARHRLARAGSPIVPTVRVVRLRRPKQETRDPQPGSIEWSHRWIVSGHWRNQWYASIQARRLKWIAPFVKGPADKPLVVQRTVHHLVR